MSAASPARISATEKLLLLSLADSGRLELHREPTNLSQLLANVIEDCVQLAPALHIEHTLAPDVQVLADPVERRRYRAPAPEAAVGLITPATSTVMS